MYNPTTSTGDLGSATASDGRPRLDDGLIRRLVRLAYNLRWSWEPGGARLFASLAPETWSATCNTIAVLRSVSRDDTGTLYTRAAAIDAACTDLEGYLDLAGASPCGGAPRVAYLSAEFAIAECLPMYAGGLGVLAGDHLKAASDLGLPIVGVGLFYRFGYFRQLLDESGYQHERYDQLNPLDLPLRPVRLGNGQPLQIGVPFPGRTVYARAWRADVGRVPLYLLDTDLVENRVDDRWITAHLYGGDQDTRIRQEMLLGIGGARLVRALYFAGLEPAPSVYHLNEGHSAFVVLELARQRLEQGVASSFDDALLQVASSVVFTTHTPVTAGHDVFASDVVEAYVADFRQQLGLSHESFMRLGRIHPGVESEPFSMTALALRGATFRNGVSRLHGFISRKMWTGVGIGVHDAPPRVAMGAITNGIHGPSWAGPEMAQLFDSYLGSCWRLAARSPATWAPLTHVAPRLLWQARAAQRARLLTRAGIKADPACALVVGFARRFATYKRADLLLVDANRLARLLAGDPHRPLAIVFAGKAHPSDNTGKLLVQRIVQASREEPFRGRLVFLPDYDVELARLLVQGADVWLNTPRRPQEASGTSGMKAILNGALHLSELDGWWDEAYAPDLGWALGAGLPEDLGDRARDAAEADQLMELLEKQISPTFFARDADGLPLEWLARVSRSISTLAPRYSAERMVADYAVRVYGPAFGDRTGPGVEQPGSVQSAEITSME